MSVKLGIIGGGVMGEALLVRLLDRCVFLASEILVSDPQVERQQALADRYGISVTGDNRLAANASDVVLLAIKPQIFQQVALALQAGEPSATTRPLVISILAGTALSQLEQAFVNYPVVRVMPNTPATIGAGMTAIAGGQQAQPHHLELAHRIFQSVGEVIEVPESLMDAVTGLSGSGPGYVAIIIEALADGGVAAGLPRAVAAQLAIQTVKGTAQLLQESGLHPAVLKDQVTSPGGTTIAGIAQLERGNLRSALIAAVTAACARSQELGK